MADNFFLFYETPIYYNYIRNLQYKCNVHVHLYSTFRQNKYRLTVRCNKGRLIYIDLDVFLLV